MKRTCIYIRVSTEQQHDKDSIPAQREALRKYIDSHKDLAFAGEYLDDGISGTKADRDELQRLLDDVRAGKLDLILITKLDRWFRSVRHYLATQEILDHYGVGWTAIWEPIYDTTTPQGRLIINQMMSIGQYEAENTSQRIRQVFAYKVQQGEAISGRTPHGYMIKDKHLVPNQYKDNVIKTFEAFARNGSFNRTLTEMAGIPGIPHHQPNLKRMLTNTIYIGQYRGNTNYCPPLISMDLWNDVQRQIPINVKKNQCYDYIFSGLIRCKDCGCSMSGNSRRYPSGKTIREYRCPKHYQRIPRQCTNAKRLKEHLLEEALLDDLSKTIARITIKVKQNHRPDNSLQILSIEKKIRRLKELYINELITLDEYKKDKEDFMAAIESLKANNRSEHTALQSLKNVNITDVYDTFSQKEKRRFWRSVVDHITFGSDRSIDITYR